MRKLAGIRICFPFGFLSQLLLPIRQELLQFGFQFRCVSLEPCSTVAEMLHPIEELARGLPIAPLPLRQRARIHTRLSLHVFLREAQGRALPHQAMGEAFRFR